jgi:hypothetical protein
MVNQSSARQTPNPEEPKAPISVRPAGHEALKTPLARPPILASEALREELAPLEPGQVGLRMWLAGLGLSLLASGLAVRLGYLAGALEHERVAYVSGALVVLAVLVPYRARGVLVGLTGLALLGLGLAGRGPLGMVVAPEVTSFGGELTRMLAAAVLPGALLFRSRYRAYRGARIALIVGLVLTVPAVVHALMVLGSGPLLARLTAGTVVLSVLASCIGFMGSGTTGASTAWAITLLVAFGIDVGARAGWMQASLGDRVAQVHAGVVFTAACALVAIGLFKVLASTLAVDARRVDVLGTEADREPLSEAEEGSD